VRGGNISLYGDAEVIYSPFFGVEYSVGSIKGIAAYTNISVRKVVMRLTPPPGVVFRSGGFVARYTDPRQRNKIIAEQKISLVIPEKADGQ
jgi:hypothetical protein